MQISQGACLFAYGDAPKGGGMANRSKLKQARAEETRKKILDAARNRFAEHGFDGTSVREIAQDCGTRHSMITYHFGTKEELWRESVRSMFALIRAEVFDPSEEEIDLPIPERFRRIARRYVRYSAKHPEHARITIAETIRGGERLEWLVETMRRESRMRTGPLFGQLVDRGIVEADQLVSLIYSYVGMVQLPFVLAKEAKLAYQYDFMSEEAIERHADFVISIFLGQIRISGES